MIKTLRKKMMTFIVTFSLLDSGKRPYGSQGISPPSYMATLHFCIRNMQSWFQLCSVTPIRLLRSQVLDPRKKKTPWSESASELYRPSDSTHVMLTKT
jgi:hypothetical protein